MSVRRNSMTRSSAALRRAVWFFTMIAALCLLSSCAAGQPRVSMPGSLLSWHIPSGKNKVVWVKSIAGPRDLGSGNGFWRRMLEVVTGAENSPIIRPYGVLRTEQALYLADPGSGVVHCLDITGGGYTVIGGKENSPLRNPIGLTEDNNGHIYISDSVTGMVYRFNPKDSSLTPFLKKMLERPTGIAFNPLNGLLYVADTLASQIVVLDHDGVERRRIGRHGSNRSGLNRPTDLVIDARGQIYVSDALNFRITVLTPEGQVVRQFGAPGDAQGFFSRPKGIAIDSDGNIYVSDFLMDAVQVFDQEGVLQVVFGRKGVAPGQFWLPSGLFIDRRNQIYVVDTYNRRIQVFRYLPNGTFEDADETADLFDKTLAPSN